MVPKRHVMNLKVSCLLFALLAIDASVSWSQKTVIRGFMEVHSFYEDSKFNFGLGEQDLFITSELTDRLTFLGETVFRFSSSSQTNFNVSIERIVLKYNFKGNHSLLLGKLHTPINYWNDTYHHGRVFFPTIERPLLFGAEIIPIHTTGIGIMGQNLGDLKFGYEFLIGNGLGSSDIADNDKHKSITAAIHIKPDSDWRLGASFYHDVISKGALVHGHEVGERIKQYLLSLSIAYFGPQVELLVEGTLATNKVSDDLRPRSTAAFLYTGYKLNDHWVPYLRFDNLHFERDEVFFDHEQSTAIMAGLRYEVNYLAVIKFEYQFVHGEISGDNNKLIAQVAVGF